MKSALGLLATALAFTVAGCVEHDVVYRPAPPAPPALVAVPAPVQAPPPMAVPASPAPPMVYTQQAPPAEIVEVQPPPPGPLEIYAWQKGHWRWNGHEYRWQRGHWVRRPPHVNMWVAPQWEQSERGWVFVEGHWR